MAPILNTYRLLLADAVTYNTLSLTLLTTGRVLQAWTLHCYQWALLTLSYSGPFQRTIWENHLENHFLTVKWVVKLIVNNCSSKKEICFWCPDQDLLTCPLSLAPKRKMWSESGYYKEQVCDPLISRVVLACFFGEDGSWRNNFPWSHATLHLHSTPGCWHECLHTLLRLQTFIKSMTCYSHSYETVEIKSIRSSN